MWDRLEGLLRDAVADGTVPGLAICVRGPDQVLFQRAIGQAERVPVARAATVQTPWDLASLTKVLGTTALVLERQSAGVLDLDRPVRDALPGAPAGVSPRHCLTHASGLPAWRPLFQHVLDRGLAWGAPDTRDGLLDLVMATPLEAAPGTRHRYSDLGMLLLGAWLERVLDDRLDRLWRRYVRPKAGADLRWGWPGAAATEDCPIRGSVVRGEVHDLNAAMMGGVAPHAGLFGSAGAVAKMGAWHLRAWLGQADQGLDPAVVGAAWSHPGPGSHHLGWDGVSPAGSSASERWPLDGVGHTGFTGTSLWIAPRQQVLVALCTNRVHPVVEGGSLPGSPPGPRYQAFRRLRVAVHRAVAIALKDRWAPAG